MYIFFILVKFISIKMKLRYKIEKFVILKHSKNVKKMKENILY